MSDKIIQLNEDLIKHDLKDLVRNSVEETLNALLDKEADELVNAEKYERSSDRQGYRSGHYKRNLHTTAGEVELKVPKLKGIPFETAIIERYRRRESSVEEALIEMYLAGVSVRRVEDITEALWGTKVSPGTISNLNKKAYVCVESLCHTQRRMDPVGRFVERGVTVRAQEPALVQGDDGTAMITGDVPDGLHSTEAFDDTVIGTAVQMSTTFLHC